MEIQAHDSRWQTGASAGCGNNRIYVDAMTIRFKTIVLLFGLVFLLEQIASPLIATAHAQESDSSSLSPHTYKELNEIQTLIKKEDYPEAERKLQKLLSSVKQSYEKAYVLGTHAYLYTSLKDYTHAIKYFKAALELKILPESTQKDMLFDLAQLYMMTEQYDQVIDTMKPWIMRAEKPSCDAYIMLGNALTQLGRYHQALEPVKKAIELSEEPKENWYQLLLAIQYQLEEYAECARTLHNMICLSPNKKTYWMQLSSVYLNLKDGDRSLAIMEMAYGLNLFKNSKDFIRLAQLFMYCGIPHNAGRLIEKELKEGRIEDAEKNWELLSNAWAQAKETKLAVQALEHAAKHSDNGDLYVRLARLRIDQEKWSEAVMALQAAFKKNIIKRKGNAYLMLGIAYYELKDSRKSCNALLEAVKFEETKKVANQWMKQLEFDKDLTCGTSLKK
jgi:tetratricopeptide (TPR) repeat protein